MCQHLKQPLLLSNYFTQNYRIGNDWDHNGVSYLRHRGRKLILAWPNGSISDPNYMTRESFHVIGTSVTLVTNDLGIRLKIPIVVTIPPHNIENDTIRTTIQSFTMQECQYSVV